MASLKDLSEKVRQYFNPTSNAGKNFWSSPVAKGLGAFQAATQGIGDPLANIVREGAPAVGRILGTSAQTNPLMVALGANKMVPDPYKQTPALSPLKDLVSAGKLGLTTLGMSTVPAIALGGGALNAGIGAIGDLINKRPVLPNLGSNFGGGYVGAAMASPIVGATNPLISRAISPVGGAVSSRIASGLGNVAQGVGIDVATGKPVGSTAIPDFLFGVAGGRGQFGRTVRLDKGAILENIDAKKTGRLLKEYDQSGRFSADALREAREMLIKLGINAKDRVAIMRNEGGLYSYLKNALTDNQRYAYRDMLGFAGEESMLPVTKGVPAAPRIMPKLISPEILARPQLPETPPTKQFQISGKVGEVPPQQLPGKTSGDFGENPLVSSIKSKVNKLYTEAIDRFHPLFTIAKQAGEDKAMRNAITGHYGAGSTASYHVDFELSPILKEQNIDELRRAAISMRDVELSGRDIRGSNTGDPIKNLKRLASELGQDKMARIGETLKKLYAYQDRMVQEYLVKTGIMSKSAYDSMRQKNQFYVPFKRVMDQVDDFLGATPQTRGAGSVSGQNIIKGIKGSEREIIDPIESIVEASYKMVGLGKRQQVAQTLVGLKDKLPKGMITKVVGDAGGRPTISLFENGKVQKYLVPKEIEDAAKGLSEEGLNTIVKILSVPTKAFRATATGINPEFAIPNVARDLQSAFVNAGLNPLKWARGLSHLMKKDEVYQEFLKSGGKTSRISIDRPMLTKTVQDISGGVKVTKPSDLLKILQNMGEYSEQPTRIALFEDAVSKGKSPIEAANIAQEGTVNFARRGSKTQSINAIYAFLNARVQGVDKLIRSIKNDPAGTSMRIGAMTAAPAVALYAWNRNFESYDDPRVVSDTDRRTNFIIMLSDKPIPELGGAQFVKIPKAEIGRIANPIEEFMRFADNRGGDVKKALVQTLGAFSPFDNIGDLIPTALRPPVEVAANKSFFYNTPIVPEYKQNFPAGFQDSPYTAPVYRMVGQKLNVSPAKIQSIVEGYGTGIAKIGELATRPLIPQQYVSPKNEQGAPINRIPLARRVFGGEKRTEEEQATTDISHSRALDFQIQDLESGIKKGQIPFEAGIAKIDKLRNEQSKLLKRTGDEEDVLYVAKLKMANKPDGTVEKIDEKTFLYRENKETKTLRIDEIPTLKLTGNETLDKEVKSQFKRDITKLANDYYKLFELGQITAEEAEKLLDELDDVQNNAIGKKPKKVSVSQRKVTIKSPAISKTPRFKVSSMTTKKAPNIKIKKPKSISIKVQDKSYPAIKVKPFRNTLSAGNKLA